MKIKKKDDTLKIQMKTIKLLQDKIKLLEFDLSCERKLKTSYKNSLRQKNKTLFKIKMEIEMFLEDKDLRRIEKIFRMLVRVEEDE